MSEDTKDPFGERIEPKRSPEKGEVEVTVTGYLVEEFDDGDAFVYIGGHEILLEEDEWHEQT